MDLSNRLSEDLIKILHNTKCAVINDVAKWTKDIHQSKPLSHQTLTDEEMLQSECNTTHLS